MSAQTLTLRTHDGFVLDARYRAHDGEEPAGVAVLCHPHPAFGGSMDVWLLPRIAERLAGDGWGVLRFNFRPGVGDGWAAIPDLAAAVDAAVALGHDDARVALVGWSFGALVCLLYGATDARISDWIGIAPPTRPAPEGWPAEPLAPIPPDLSSWRARRSVIVGAHDQFYPPAEVGCFAAHDVRVLPDADHFFFDRDDEIAALVAILLEHR